MPERCTDISLKALDAEILRLERRQSSNRLLLAFLTSLLAIAAAAVLLSQFWLTALQVEGTSMNPDLAQGDKVLAIHSGVIKKNDVIAFYFGNRIMIKRVIAVGGETVDIDAQGAVSVDGRRLDEPYVTGQGLGDCDIELPFKTPDGEYFVMGDNRAASEDSRLAIIGPVKKQQALGKVIFKLWPINRMGFEG